MNRYAMSEKTKAHSPCAAGCSFQPQMRNAFRAAVGMKILQCPLYLGKISRCLPLVGISESFPEEIRYKSSFGVV